MEIINLGAGDGLPPVDWAAITEKLDAGSAPAPDAHNSRTTWLATVNEDGSPHVTAVGALWLDGAFWFQTGSGTRKSRNVAGDPRCSIAVWIRDADVVIEGDAARMTDPGIVARDCKGVGGQRLASGARRERFRHHRAVQRAISRTATVVRVSHPATLGDCRVGHRARRPHSLQVLTPGARRRRLIRAGRCRGGRRLRRGRRAGSGQWRSARRSPQGGRIRVRRSPRGTLPRPPPPRALRGQVATS